MKLRHIIFAMAMVFAIVAGIFPATAQPSTAVATPPVYVPDTSRQNQQLPDGIIAWDATSKTTDAAADQGFARFTFSFTNLNQEIKLGLTTNVITSTNFTTITNSSFWARLWGNRVSKVSTISTSTNIVTVTNSTPMPITILDVKPSCGCTTVELPPRPWTIPGGSNGTINVSVDLAGKTGIVFKSVAVTTDQGRKDLMLRINIQPPVPMKMTDEQLATGIAAAKVDRQAVFKGDCAACHMKNIEGKMGQPLYDSLCGVCHEAEHRATMVPDLSKLTVPTNEEFWRTWITIGKPGSLMPAFATSQGGPLTDMQISSLAAYLNLIHPSRVPFPPAAK